ncbi:MAG TPA: RHS repeat domain-containing protein [Pyrinomonadaceae bacterium]|nr:RHS repeat domain-containing protein [Pyrinomonadaceae bacterium]
MATRAFPGLTQTHTIQDPVKEVLDEVSSHPVPLCLDIYLALRCNEIKDRNGNLISATFDPTYGHLSTITDTLGRVITFVYDASSNLQAIRQTWSGVAHDWATFEYGQVCVAPSFGGGLLVNGPNNNYVTVLNRVNLHDGTYFTFAYNVAFGQVNRINHYAADGHLLEYTSYNVDSSAPKIPRMCMHHPGVGWSALAFMTDRIGRVFTIVI